MVAFFSIQYTGDRSRIFSGGRGESPSVMILSVLGLGLTAESQNQCQGTSMSLDPSGPSHTSVKCAVWGGLHATFPMDQLGALNKFTGLIPE